MAADTLLPAFIPLPSLVQAQRVVPRGLDSMLLLILNVTTTTRRASMRSPGVMSGMMQQYTVVAAPCARRNSWWTESRKSEAFSGKAGDN